MKTAPLISVLLPARNAAAYIDESLESVFNQTLQDFEIIAVNDGSTDGTLKRLQSWAARDRRLHVVTRDGGGPAEALNTAIAHASGQLLARMDADDINLPERFATQAELLHQNPSVGVCGTWVRVFGAAGRHTWRLPADDQAIRAYLRFGSPFAHPSVMMRREVVATQSPVYRPELGRAEDYDLWERLQPVCEFANVPRVLFRYRTHPGQVTVRESGSSLTGGAQVRRRMLRAWWPELTDAEMDFHQALCTGSLPCTTEAFAAAEQWLLRLIARNERHPLVQAEAWRNVLSMKWWEVCRHFAPLGGAMLQRFCASTLLQRKTIPAGRWLRLWVEGLTSGWRVKEVA